MGLEQVFLLDEAAVTGKNGRAHMAADAIIDGIAKNARRQQHQHHFHIAHKSGPGHHARREQQRVARQKGRYHKAGLTKNDDKKYGVNPKTVLCNQFEKMHVNVQNKVNKIAYYFHTFQLRGLISGAKRLS